MWHTADMPKLINLKDFREASYLTQGELADRAKISRNTIIRLEAGDDAPYPRTVRKLAAALGCQPEELAGRPSLRRRLPGAGRPRKVTA
jgi:transcriptional regulator with XRE-family HTH domain